MKKILIAAPYSTLPSDNFVNRFAHLATQCAERGHSTTLATGRFCHRTKDFHTADACLGYDNLDVVLIDNRAYRSHIGLERIQSLRDFRQNFDERFADLDQFDIIYSAYPAIGHNLSIARRRDAKKTQFIVDIQDVWPESFSSVLPLVKNIPHNLLPFSGAANRVYSSADGLVAVSRTYLNRATSVNDRAKRLVAYLGSEFDMVDTVPVPDRPFKLFYIGTLSYSYDIDTIIRAVDQLSSAGRNVEFHIFGGGPDLERLRGLSGKGTTFHGFLPYKEMEAELRKQHVAVNAIRAKAPQSVTNKLCDYLALGCPILNSQAGEEERDLVSGVPHQNYRAGDIDHAREAIANLMDDPATFKQWRANSRFSRGAISDAIIDFIEIF